MLSVEGDLTPFKRYDVLNHLISKRGYKSYLEVGTSEFVNFNNVNIEFKECVDPSTTGYKYTYNMTSDEAFKEIKRQNKKYDIIFIDGLHWSEQVTKDIENSLSVLNKNGIIVLHDCNPPTAMHARYPIPNPCNCPWNGDCYKSIIRFKYVNPTIFTCVVDTDWGVGIIDPFLYNYRHLNISNLERNSNDDLVGGVLHLDDTYLTWDYFDKNRRDLLNLISVEEFKILF